MFTHSFDPVLVNFGLIEIRWYSLAYIFGILIGWWYGKKIIIKRFIFEKQTFNLKEFDNLVTYIVFSIILGGRIGYVIFYNLEYFLSNPLEILKIWEGGMSFHGALIGIIIGTYLFSTKKNIKTLFFLDIIACVAPIGIMFGRIANFINGELWGKISYIHWAVIFPQSGSLEPRHPSQIYQSICEGFLVFILILFLRKSKWGRRPGVISCSFLIFYSFARIAIEFFRYPDSTIYFNWMTKGQLYSLVFIIFSLIIMRKLKLFNQG